MKGKNGYQQSSEVTGYPWPQFELDLPTGVNPTYWSWNAAVGAYFFNSRKRLTPTFFSVDTETVREIGRRLGVEPELAFGKFTMVARQKFPRALNMLAAWKVNLPHWESDQSGYPPYLGVLGVSVLAASLMAEDEAMTAANYYGRLNPLLGRSKEAGMPEGFDDLVGCWKHLDEWLKSFDGELGISTIPEKASPAFVGYPESQSLFRESDRQRLFEYFEWLGLAPNDDEVGEQELVLGFRSWMLQTHNTSSRARSYLDSTDGGSRLGSILLGTYHSWDGTSLSAHGRTRTTLTLQMRIVRRGRARLGFWVPRREEDPDRLPLRLSGVHFELPARGAWFGPLTLRNPMDLANGFKAERTDAEFRDLLWPMTSVIVLLPDPASDLGGYTSAPRLEVGARHLLLVGPARRPDVEHLVALNFPGAGQRQFEGLPPDWVCFEGLEVGKPIPTSSFPESLRHIAPAHGAAMRLADGLRVGDRKYLTGGEPDLSLSVPEGIELKVRVDGRELGSVSGEERIFALRLEELETGHHEVAFGSVRRRFETVVGTGPEVVEGTGSLGELVANDGTRISTESEQLRVCGAAIPYGESADYRKPIVVRYRGHPRETHILLGSCPGEYAEQDVSERPALLQRLGIESRMFVQFDNLSFEPALHILHQPGKHGDNVSLEPLSAEPVGSSVGDVGMQVRWARAVRFAATKTDSSSSQLASFLETAKLILANQPSETDSIPYRIQKTDAIPAVHPSDFGFTLSFDQLLRWMSEVGSGKWSSFRETARWIWESEGLGKAEPGVTAYDLSALGFAEFSRVESGLRWCVAPPTVTYLPNSGGFALLTGARTGRFMQRFTELSESDDFDFFMYEEGGLRSPTAILLATDLTATEDFATRLGINFSTSVSERLSNLLPHVSSIVGSCGKRSTPEGYDIDWFDETQLKWVPTDDSRRSGLYRYDTYGSPSFRLVGPTSEPVDVPKRVGIWEVLRQGNHNVLLYDLSTRTLLVPGATPLPSLAERCAALCLGLLPEIVYPDKPIADLPELPRLHLAYRNVPQTIAERIAHSLGQKLQEAQ